MRNSQIALALLALLGGVLACNAPTPDTPVAESLDSPSVTVAVESAGTAMPTQPLDPSPEPVAATPEPRSLRIVYVEAGDLWSLKQGSVPIQLTESGRVNEVLVSDDGELIVYVLRDPDSDTAELRSMLFDGTSDHSLVNAETFDALYPLEGARHITLSQLAVVPQSHRILLNTRTVFEGPGLAKNNDLLSIDPADGVLTTILDRGHGGDFLVSPDGTQIAIVRPDSIGFADINGENPRPEVLTFPWVITYSEYFFYPLPIWSGDSVLAAIPAEDPFFGAPGGSIWRVPTDGTAAELMASPPADLFTPQREAPLFAPDASSIAYLRTAGSSGDTQLWIQQLVGEEAIPYDAGTIQWKGWSMDSGRFVYARNSGLDLYMGRLGYSPERIGSGTGLRWISATEYLYLAGSPGGWTLTLSALDGESDGLAELTGDFVYYDYAN